MKNNKFLKLFLAIFTIINFNTLFGAAAAAGAGAEAKNDQKEAFKKIEVSVLVDGKFIKTLKLKPQNNCSVSFIKKQIQKQIQLNNPENFDVTISLKTQDAPPGGALISREYCDAASQDKLRLSDLPKEFSFIADIKSKK